MIMSYITKKQILVSLKRCVFMRLCSSEEELPTPSAFEEKVRTFLFSHVACSDSAFHLKHLLPPHIFSGPCVVSFLPPAKAAGVGASGEMAEDGEEMGQVQEQ